MAKYDFFIAGRWRNYKEVKKVLDLVRANGKTAYCFIENLYKGHKIEFKHDESIEVIMRITESLPHDDKFMKMVFNTDMEAEKNSDSILVVLPVGNSGHIEAGVAYGLGKKCYAVGKFEKNETLNQIFDKIFPDLKALDKWLSSS